MRTLSVFAAGLLTLGRAQPEDVWRMRRDRGAGAHITMTVTPMHPQTGDLVRCVVDTEGLRLDPDSETAVVMLPDRILRVALHPLAKSPRLGFSFLATAPGRARIQLESCREEFELRIDPAARPPRGGSRAIMQGLFSAWNAGDFAAVRDLAPAVKTLLPLRYQEDLDEFRALADRFRREIEELRAPGVAHLRRIELYSCLRCHLKFRWGLVGDISRFPELPRE